MRSATTVAGIVGVACNNSRIRGSTSSTSDPRAALAYDGGLCARIAARTVFFEHPITLAIALIGIRSARCRRRISAQSSTFSTRFLLTSVRGQASPEGGQFSVAARGSVFTRRRQSAAEVLGRECP